MRRISPLIYSITFYLYFILRVEGAVICPPEDTYAPCTCSEYSNRPGTIFLNCFRQNLNDSKANDILGAFITTPSVSPVGELNMWNNKLTRVPDQIKSLPQLEIVYLHDNEITSIDAGAFNHPNGTSPLFDLYLMNNQLTTISPGAFKGNGYGNGTQIWLSRNNLTRFEATVFQSVLEKLAPIGGLINSNIEIFDNPFDCSDCHLAWLIRDNVHLLPAVDRGHCENGTSFEQLDPVGYANCPSFVCPLGYDGDYPDPLTCSSYYNCRENIAYPNDCPADLVFNAETSQCDALANVPSCQS